MNGRSANGLRLAGHGRCRPRVVRSRTAPKRLRLEPISVKELALSLPKSAWHKVEWRVGTAERLPSRFAHVRVHIARNGVKRSERRPEEWPLIE